MTKNFLIIFLLISFHSAFSQHYHSNPDSSIYKIRRHYDSLYNNDPRVIALMEKIAEQQKLEKQYDYVAFHGGITKTNYNAFNTAISSGGYSQFNTNSASLGIFTIGTMQEKVMFEFAYIDIGFGSKSKNSTGGTFKHNVSNFLEMNLGYNPWGMTAIALYPVVGIGLRNRSLNFDKDVSVNLANPPYAYLSSNTNWDADQLKVAYSASLQLDLRISKPKNYIDSRGTGIILFTRVSYNGVFGKDRLRIEDVELPITPKVEPIGIRFGIKLYNTTYTKLVKEINRRKHQFSSTNYYSPYPRRYL